MNNNQTISIHKQQEPSMKLPSLAEVIRICAYLIWEREGRPSGRDHIHWREAEEQLKVGQAHDQWMMQHRIIERLHHLNIF